MYGEQAKEHQEAGHVWFLALDFGEDEVEG
jgi:hypothetical protein